MVMDQEYLMYIASLLYFICYVPILYADCKNKNANIYNLPERLIMLAATTFALIYSINIQNNALIVNYAPNLIMESGAVILKIKYIIDNYNNEKNNTIENLVESKVLSPIHNLDNNI